MKALIRVPDLNRTCERLAASLPHRLHLNFYGAHCSLASATERPLIYLKRVYGHFLAEGGTVGARRMIVLEEDTQACQILSRHLRPDGTTHGHVLVADWFEWAFVLQTEALLRYYASKLLRLEVVRRLQPEIMTLHAASIQGPTVGLLLVGEAASGKTSTLLRLIERGYRYAADDTTCIRRRDLVCVPFPMPLLVRPDLATGRPSLAELLGRDPDIQVLDEPRWLVERWDSVACEFRPSHLLFLGANSMAPGEIREISPARAVVELLGNVVFPLGAEPAQFDHRGQDFDLAVHLVERTRCFCANTQDPQRTLYNMLDLFERSSPGR